MTNGSAAPPLPPPPHPAAAARAVSEAARAAADAWAQPMETAQFNRVLSQLYSVLGDLGVAVRGLAHYQTTGNPADPAPLGFRRHVQAGAQHLLNTWQSLDGVLVAEGFSPVPDPDEPARHCARPRAPRSRRGDSRQVRAPTAIPPWSGSSRHSGFSPLRPRILRPTRPGSGPSSCSRWVPA